MDTPEYQIGAGLWTRSSQPFARLYPGAKSRVGTENADALHTAVVVRFPGPLRSRPAARALTISGRRRHEAPFSDEFHRIPSMNPVSETPSRPFRPAPARRNRNRISD